ncbi:hypothetical protein [Methylocystis bryophila]|uniref:PEP-CTERM sorting domain-containing protein n=1 Tax=Methylocystis bryophila TaxID=655015 RepID=A0A1W6MRL3_9HYPH|nr:hypothetical protein [Methylocystis bryophila]ARN80202.1 hypothetical protein B1812_02875 [Methylocystis bryophila]BDV40152.1 hypothetical protein DSM21852_34050 [Methylocystis bryophila]
MRISWLAIAAATLAFGGSAHATEFITNGDFSQLTAGLGQLGYNTNATGWSVPDPNTGGSYAFVFNNGATSVVGQSGPVSLWTQSNGGSSTWNGASVSGHNFVAMDGVLNVGALTQNISGLTVGNQYTLTFDYAFGQQFGYTGDTTNQWNFSLGGSSASTPNYSVASQGFSGWQTESYTFTATSTSELLSFIAQGGPSPGEPPFALLTDVSLTSSAPGPGPATGPLAVLGLLGLGYARLRRARGQA